MLQKRSAIKTKVEVLLKSGDEGDVLQSLEDAEQRRAEAHANSATDKSTKNGTSPQKEQQPDDEQNELDGHDADERQDPRSDAKSLQREELSIHRMVTKPKATKLLYSRKRQV